MKHSMLVLMAALLFSHCQVSSSEKKVLTGTYTRIADTELYVLYDTLTVSLITEQAKDLYTITERSSSHFKKAEDESFNKRTTRSISGTYDPENNVIRTEDPGLVYSFDIAAGTATINGIVYRKIK